MQNRRTRDFTIHSFFIDRFFEFPQKKLGK
jgi:hypothetical protein